MVSSKKSWILAAHGSRVEDANRQIRELAASLSRRLKVEIFPAFLELAEPSIPTAIDRAAASGADQIYIIPFFLTEGRHLQEDIGRILRGKIEQYPEARIETLAYFGGHPGILELLEKIIGEKEYSGWETKGTTS